MDPEVLHFPEYQARQKDPEDQAHQRDLEVLLVQWLHELLEYLADPQDL